MRKPKGYLLALLYNAAQAAPESNLYAQFFAMPPEEHKPSFDIKLYEKYDIFDYLNEERSPEHGTWTRRLSQAMRWHLCGSAQESDKSQAISL